MKNSFGVFPLDNSDNCSSQSMVLVPSTTLNETNDQKFISKRVSLKQILIEIVIDVTYHILYFKLINRVLNQYLVNRAIQVT